MRPDMASEGQNQARNGIQHSVWQTMKRGHLATLTQLLGTHVAQDMSSRHGRSIDVPPSTSSTPERSLNNVGPELSGMKPEHEVCRRLNLAERQWFASDSCEHVKQYLEHRVRPDKIYHRIVDV